MDDAKQLFFSRILSRCCHTIDTKLKTSVLNLPLNVKRRNKLDETLGGGLELEVFKPPELNPLFHFVKKTKSDQSSPRVIYGGFITGVYITG